jgi:hypothetical protein
VYSLLVPVDIPGAVVRFVEVIKDGSGQVLRDAQGRIMARLEVNGQQVLGVVEEAASVVARLRARLVRNGWQAADIDLFLTDFANNADALAKFDNGTLDFDVWKKFAILTGDTKVWVRKSVALQERIKAKGLTNEQIDRLKDYYSGHLSKSDVTTYPMTSPSTGQYYDEFGHPDFTKSVLEIRKKDGTLGRPVYEPQGGITGDRAKDARLANEEMAANFDPDDFRYTPGSNTCRIKKPTSPYADSEGFVLHTWHHHQDGKTMMAVPKNIHDASNASHIGGVQVKNAGIIGFFDSPFF